MKNLISMPILFCIFSFAGCTHRAWYDTAQNNGKHKCTQKPTQQEYQDCMALYEKPYDQYERERKELLEEQ